MNKKGYTLVEIMAVIVLIGIVISIVTISTIKISRQNNERSLKVKRETLLSEAELYGTDYPNIFNSDGDATITIKQLIDNGYSACDASFGDNNCDFEKGCVINPVTKANMNSEKIFIKKNQNKIQAMWISEFPTIEINPKEVTYDYDSNYDLLEGVTTTNQFGDIIITENNIIITSTTKLSEGTHTIKYEVSDEMSNSASETRIVNITREPRYICASGYTLIESGTYLNYCSKNLSCPIGTIDNGICYTTDSSVFSSITRYCCGSTCYSSNGTCTSTSSSTYSASIGCNSGWTYDSGAGSCYRSSSCSSGTKTSISGTYRCVQKTYGNATICNNSCSNYCSGANCISGNPSCSSGSLSSNNNLCYSSSNIRYTCNSGDSLSGTTCTHTSTSTYSRTASTTNSCISTWTLGSNQCYKTATCEYGTLDNGVCYTTDSNIRSENR